MIEDYIIDDEKTYCLNFILLYRDKMNCNFH